MERERKRDIENDRKKWKEREKETERMIEGNGKREKKYKENDRRKWKEREKKERERGGEGKTDPCQLSLCGYRSE
jgi:hypothetical protein